MKGKGKRQEGNMTGIRGTGKGRERRRGGGEIWCCQSANLE